MSRKKFIFFCLLVIAFIFTSFLVEQIHKSKKREEYQVSVQKENVKKAVVKVKKKTIFEEEQVVKEAVYPYLNLEEKSTSTELLPRGTVVSVKPVPDNSERVEIISEPKKGYIAKKNLEPRQNYINARELNRAKKLSKNDFQKKINHELTQFTKQKGGDISVYVETVDEKMSYSFYGDEVKRTASSIKLPFIAYLMDLVDQGKVSLDTKLTYTKNFKIDGTGIIQFEPFDKQFTIEELAELTIRYSDNVAYIMLLNYLGEEQFINYLAKLDSKSPNNRVYSTARILTKAMKVVNEDKEESKNKMLLYRWLQESIFDDGVAVGLPSVDVNHKTGWMPMHMVSNDIALVKDKKAPYYLTIMTIGYDLDYSEQVIGDIAKIIDRNMLDLAL